jgi:hypothetical protein
MIPLLATNLACRYLAFTLMLFQANWFCEKLDLHRDHKFTQVDVREGSTIGPLQTNDFCGSLLTDDYFFGFDAGHICSFVRRGHQAQNDADVKRQNIEWSRHPSLIDTNGAIQLATNWLASSGIKLSVLLTNFTLKVSQWTFYPEYQPTNSGPVNKDAVLLPIFQVEWYGDFVRKGRVLHHGPVVKVVVSGMTKELWQCDVYSEQLVSYPPIAIRDFKSVLSISDEEFQRYDDLQRSNFVAQYGGLSLK